MKFSWGGGRKEELRICYFGTYSMEEGYPRNRVIIEGLRKNGVDAYKSLFCKFREVGAYDALD